MAQITAPWGVPGSPDAEGGGMTTYSFGPLLVSELPPVGPLTPGPLARLRTHLRQRVAEHRFEVALRSATPHEQSDLLAAARRG
jgi:hypothetical protein